MGRLDVKQMLSELAASELDEWYQAVTGRPWYLDPQRYYGNHHLSMVMNMHTKAKDHITPAQADIYYREQPKAAQHWRDIKAAMRGVSGAARTDNV